MRHAFLSLFLLAACTPPSVVYAPTNPPPRPVAPRNADRVAILFTPPSCPYVEIGFVETTAPILRRDWSIPQKIEALRNAAAVHGADAVLMVGHTDSSAENHGPIGSHNYSAVAIDWVGDPCVLPCDSASGAPGC